MAKNTHSSSIDKSIPTTGAQKQDDDILHNGNGNNKQDLPFYPAFCFPASPTHFTWVKMSVADIHRLRTRTGFEGQDIFFYKNHPIQFVCVAGYIISRDDYERRTVLTLDDSSGAILEVIVLKAPVDETTSTSTAAATAPEMTHVTSTARRTPIDITTIQPGAALKIKGTLARKSQFRPTMQVVLERFWMLDDTAAEIRFWNERARFLIDVLSEPWSLTNEEIEALRQQARIEERAAVKEKYKMQERKKRWEERERKYHRRIVRRWEAEEKLREKESERVVESNKRWLAKRAGLSKILE